MNAYPIPWRLNLLHRRRSSRGCQRDFLAGVDRFIVVAGCCFWQLRSAVVGNSIYSSLHEAEHGILLARRIYGTIPSERSWGYFFLHLFICCGKAT